MTTIDSDKEDQSFYPLKRATLMVCCLGFAGVGMFFYPPKFIADWMVIFLGIILGGGGALSIFYDDFIYPYYKSRKAKTL